MKNVIDKGFNPDRKCQYEALALKLELSQVIVKIRQLMDEYKEQEFPDVFEHLRMIRAVNQSVQNWIMMNVGNISSAQGLFRIGMPRARSTPTHKRQNTNLYVPHSSIKSRKTPTNVGAMTCQNDIGKTFKTTENSQITPPSGIHERTFNAVRNIENFLNQLLNTPQTPLNNTRKRSTNKKQPTFNVSRTQLPRRRMNFSRSFTQRTPQTK